MTYEEQEATVLFGNIMRGVIEDKRTVFIMPRKIEPIEPNYSGRSTYPIIETVVASVGELWAVCNQPYKPRVMHRVSLTADLYLLLRLTMLK